MLNKLINNADESDPIIYRLSHKQNIPLYENSLPIHRKYMINWLYCICENIVNVDFFNGIQKILSNNFVKKISNVWKKNDIKYTFFNVKFNKFSLDAQMSFGYFF